MIFHQMTMIHGKILKIKTLGGKIMALDGNFVHALVEELSVLKRGKINKIHQIDDYHLIFRVRANRKNQQLLISAHPTFARFHITEEKYDTPFNPPTFLRVLRKHIDGGFITDIKQIGNDRRVEIHITSRNEMGDETQKILILEIMGRHSNIVLTDIDYKILDGIKHLTPNNNARTIMPGVQYEAPPTQNQVNPRTKLEQLPSRIDFNAGKVEKQIVRNSEGLSPLFVSELKYQVGYITINNIVPGIKALLEKGTNIEPTMYETGNRTLFYYMPLEHLAGENSQTFDSLSALLDEYYTHRYRKSIVRQMANDYYQIVERLFEKTTRKLEHLKNDLKETESKEEYQKYGELLTAYMHEVKPYTTSVKVMDYYTDKEIEIPLDPNKSPSDNAQKYYQMYNKLKNRETALVQQIKNAERDIEYYDSLIHQMSSISTEQEVAEIREELVEQGVLRKRAETGKKKKATGIVLSEYRTSGGFTVWVGKNNKQNDYLTNKKASKNHVWFHTKDIPGSHVVIAESLENVGETDLMEAAMIAAYFSKAGASESVPVDFTEIANVTKISGAKPGFVTYKNQKTLYVTPEKQVVDSMRVDG